MELSKNLSFCYDIGNNCGPLSNLCHVVYATKGGIKEVTVPLEQITGKIFLIRDQKVMLDRDLAELYGVQTKALKQAVRRNVNRFPPDFMFELKKEEFQNLRSQFVTSSWGGSRYVPMVFTEQGVAKI